MRKGLFVASVVVALIGSQAGVVLATGIGDTGPGCGLGKEIWKNESNTDTIGKQFLSSNSKCNTTGLEGLRCCHANEILSTHEC